MNLFCLLILAHLLGDYPLQGDYLAKMKNRTFARVPYTEGPWWLLLGSHAFIHAGLVGLLTGSYLCAAFEFIAHFAIDYAKTQRRISFVTDQVLHLLCKVAYTAFIGLCVITGVDPL